MPSLAEVDRDTFANRVGERFRIDAHSPALELELIEVGDAGRQAAGPDAAAKGGRPFQLLFRGPAEPLLPQAIHELGHAELGRLGIFLVPVGPDAEGMRYEAIFT
jgi:hypothetical protein